MQDMETIGLPDYGINTAAAHGPRIRGYTADQMREYGEACAKAEREACAVAAWLAGMDYHNTTLGLPVADAREVGSKCAKDIRARSLTANAI